MSLDGRVVVRRGPFELDVELTAEPGEVLAVLGPNGSGKTTLLRALSGVLALDEGRLELDGRVVDEPGAGTWVEPAERGVGLVPQDLLLFGHLDAADNVAFGLRARGVGRAEARTAAVGWLERFGIGELAASRARDLSGGQAQRAALARALAIDPTLLLLDEPLASLDPSTRHTTRRDLRGWLDEFGGVAVMVSHDPLDALTLADRVLVLEDGRATQAGALAEVAARPRTAYVAQLLGTNLLGGRAEGTMVALAGGGAVELADAAEGDVLVTIPPRAITVHLDRPEGSARNRWAATIAAIDLLGDRVRLHCDGEVPLVAEVTTRAVTDLGLRPGASLWLAVKATEVEAYPA